MFAKVVVARREHHAIAFTIDQPDPNVPLPLQLRAAQKVPAIQPDKRRIEPLLGLPADVLKDAGQEDDHRAVMEHSGGLRPCGRCDGSLLIACLGQR